MELGPGEVQILRGPNITVTDRRIAHDKSEIAVADIAAPQIEATMAKISVRPTMLTLAVVFLAVGAGVPRIFFLVALGVAWFGFSAKVNRAAFAVTVETAGARRPIYVTAKEADAKLALAAVLEAQRRSGA